MLPSTASMTGQLCMKQVGEKSLIMRNRICKISWTDIYQTSWNKNSLIMTNKICIQQRLNITSFKQVKSENGRLCMKFQNDKLKTQLIQTCENIRTLESRSFSLGNSLSNRTIFPAKTTFVQKARNYHYGKLSYLN